MNAGYNMYVCYLHAEGYPEREKTLDLGDESACLPEPPLTISESPELDLLVKPAGLDQVIT